MCPGREVQGKATCQWKGSKGSHTCHVQEIAGRSEWFECSECVNASVIRKETRESMELDQVQLYGP